MATTIEGITQTGPLLLVPIQVADVASRYSLCFLDCKSILFETDSELSRVEFLE
jgi:hypothetical protein